MEADGSSVEAQLWVHRATAPALVLGSTQPDDVVDRARAEADGVEVCHRRSGGGLVYLDPATDCWIDLIVPPWSRWWDADVGRAFHWVGEHWADVLASLGPRAPEGAGDRPLVRPMVNRGADRSDAGRLWCFGGLGHGEVTIGGAKVVGLSQRRTRNWIRLQTVVAGTWPVDRLRRYVRLADRAPTRQPDGAGSTPTAVTDPAEVRAGLPAWYGRPDPDVLAGRFVSTLPPP